MLEIVKVHYYSCCRDGNYRSNESKRKTEEKRLNQKTTRKLNSVCISRMYVNEYRDSHVEVTYISAHSGHELGTHELPFLPLPESTKEAVSRKISQGVPTPRILEGMFLCVYVIVLHAMAMHS